MSKYTNLLTYLKIEQPELITDQSGLFQSFKYIGPTATLTTNKPDYNDDWNGVPVIRVLGPTRQGLSSVSELVVETKTPDFSAVTAAGLAAITNAEFPLLEIEEQAVEKSLRQHPAFATATADMWQSIDDWLAETDSTARAAYSYYKRDKDGAPAASTTALDTSNVPDKSMQDFAILHNKGVESFVDYLPLARKTELYFGQDKPTVGPIGTKIAGTPFASAPSGYEWVLTAYAARKQGRGFYWTVVREWIGAIKVLVDSTTIY